MEKSPPGLELILRYFTDFTPKQIAQLTALDALYRDWNSKINVISRKDIDSLYEKHVLHSLSIAAVTGFAPGTEIIDIGTGGGFPGIPLAIFFPDVHFHLADSIAKKLKVVQEVISAAGLPNVTTQHIRAEEIRNRKFDYAVSRAVAPLNDLWRWARPLLRKSVTGKAPVTKKHKTAEAYITPGLICLKGGDLAPEIAASGTKPFIVDIHTLFPETYFVEKYLLHVRMQG